MLANAFAKISVASAALAIRLLDGTKRSSVARLRQTHALAEAGPEFVGLQEDQLNPPAVLGLVPVHQRIDGQPGRCSRDPVDIEEVGRTKSTARWPTSPGPAARSRRSSARRSVPGGTTRRTRRRPASPHPAGRRTPDPGRRAFRVPNGVSVYATPPRARYVAASNPPRSRSGPRTPSPVPRAMMIFGLNARMSSTVSRARSSAPGSQLVRNTSALANSRPNKSRPSSDLDVDRDAALAAVSQLEDEVGVRAGRFAGETADDQRPPGITRGDALHLDHVGAPVRQGGTGRRYVGPRRQLDNPDTTEHARHRQPSGRVAFPCYFRYSSYSKGYR